MSATSHTSDVSMKEDNNNNMSVVLLGKHYENPLFHFKTTKALAVKTQISKWCKKIDCMKEMFVRIVRTDDDNRVTMRFISRDKLHIQVINGTFSPNVWELARFNPDKDLFSIDSSQLILAMADVESNQQEMHWIAMPNGAHSIVLPKSGHSFSCVTEFFDVKVDSDEADALMDYQGDPLSREAPLFNVKFKPDELLHSLVHLEQTSDDSGIFKLTVTPDTLGMEAGRSKRVMNRGRSSDDEGDQEETTKWNFKTEQLIVYYNIKFIVQNTQWISNHADSSVILSLKELSEDKMFIMFQQNMTFKELKGGEDQILSSTLSFLMNREAPN